METFAVGERVLSHVGSGGTMLRPGVVTAVLEGTFLTPNPQYMVLFDGDQGHSGPCLYVEPEPKRELSAVR